MTERLLLDTHSLLWVVEGRGRLHSNTLRAIDDPANEVFVSAVNVWEIAIKLTSGRSPPVRDIEIVLQAVGRYGFRELPVTFRHAEIAANLPLNPPRPLRPHADRAGAGRGTDLGHRRLANRPLPGVHPASTVTPEPECWPRESKDKARSLLGRALSFGFLSGLMPVRGRPR